MKIFVYKSLFIFFCLIIFYKLTIDSSIYKFKTVFYNLSTKENISNFKDKIRNELENSLKKDRILNKDDALLIKKIIKKINSEINDIN